MELEFAKLFAKRMVQAGVIVIVHVKCRQQSINGCGEGYFGGGGGSEKDILPSEFRGTEAYFLLNTLSPTKLNNVMTSRL
jgi:hypothetical protein